ncbi:MAG: nucleotide exchange factor GrpE [Anaerolineales bacterium]|jgi:molecular chaperone GrpE|nr:nucleotide exchange factor GrpE [Anaerolineales bacterium]
MTEEYKEEVPGTKQAAEETNQPEAHEAEDELHEVTEIEVIDSDDEEDLGTCEELEMRLAEALSEKEEYLDGWQRTQADFANYKKRVERDRQQVQQNATANVVRRYLEILDDLERALANQPQDGEGAVWANGIDLVYRKWLNALEVNDVKPMEVDDQLFDPELHEAISHEESDEHESGEVIEVVQTGYFIGDRVLRPARVRVAQ